MHLLRNQQTAVLWGSFWSRHLWVAHTEKELKDQLSPRVKEEKLKSLLTVTQTMLLYLQLALSTQPLQNIQMDNQGSPSHGRCSFSSCGLCGDVY